ncbi:hypothetical protein [Kitasatospora sp. NPDC050543]|uniref:hypothetical protein n=1 Tax=Kitasatospora sp. NPDC050543 TaxID=3364054 RepID=UPI00378FA9BB
MATPERTEEQGPRPGTTAAPAVTAPATPSNATSNAPAKAAPAAAPPAGASRLSPAAVRARLRRAAAHAPGRLRLAGALLAALTLAFGVLTAWQTHSRAQAADRVVSYSEPLSQAAADIHRSLADADTTAATGFLLAGSEPKPVRQRYEDDIATASRLIAEAAARTTASSPAQQWLSALNQQLPVYAGLVESARANNRQGYPLGGAYLRYASEQMRGTLLPAAEKLAAAENQQLERDYADARAVPWASWALGLLALAALVLVQQVLYRRTNRVFNLGLLGATASMLAALLWLGAGGLVVDGRLADGERLGSTPLRALNTARVDVLTARLAENLHFVARGSSTKYAELWGKTTEGLAGRPGPDGSRDARAGTLAQAEQLAPRDAADAVRRAREQFTVWDERHNGAVKAESVDGNYQAAVDATITTGEADIPKTSDAAFAAADRDLAQAATVEQASFLASARGTGGLLNTMSVGAGVLALLAAVCALRGLGRRLAEYR